MLLANPGNRGHMLRVWLAEHAAVLGMLLLVGVGAIVAGSGIATKPFWTDESASFSFATGSFRRLVDTLANREYIMVLYQLFLWPWSRLVGTSEVMLRLPSLVFGLAALPVVVLIARRVVELRWALFAGLLLTLSGFFVHYAQEARGYTLVMLLGALSLWALLRAIEQPSWPRWLTYAVVGAIGVWSQPVMAFLLAGQAAAVLLHPNVRSWWRRAAVAYVALALAFLPLGLAMVFLGGGRWTWVDPPSIDQFVGQLRIIAGHGDMAHLTLWLVAWSAGAAVALRRWWGDRRAGWPALLLAIAALAVIGGLAGVSLIRPMFVARYAIVALPALVLLAALFLSAVRERAVVAVLVAALLLVGVDGVLRWQADRSRQDWRAAARLVVENHHAGDGIAFLAHGQPFAPAPRTYNYYIRQLRANESKPTVVRLAADECCSLADRIGAALTDYDRLWIVGPWLSRPRAKEVLDALAPTFEPTQTYALDGRLQVQLYERAASLSAPAPDP